MLCTKYFKKSSLIDNFGKRLVKSAVPDEECDKITLADLNLEQRNVIQHIVGPSTTKQPLSENIQKTITVPNVFEPVAGPSKCIQPLCENVHYKTIPDKTSAITQVTESINPVAAANPSRKTKRIKNMLIKMKYHLRKINRLQKTVKHLKNEAFLKVLSKNDSVNEILKCKISPSFALFLQGELQNYKKIKRSKMEHGLQNNSTKTV
ncbi:unnamed protein product [Parnassius apollo]|uniref:(apollo) hypothetical protein n=1 Tax=Parnassius apollo TaxID=110799 RepID=A0A8S3XUS7_PARAO|nr:unnamed protein product [Parnassius apollo]